MAALDKLETSLDSVFGKSAPQLPERGRENLVTWLPWINLILGIFTLLSVYWLWHWAHVANGFVDYANQLSHAFGGGDVASTTRLTVGIWLGLVVLAVEAVLFIAAYPGTKARKKSGWNLLFYALLVNIVYGVVMLFTDYGGASTLIGTLIGSAVGLWLLFQIRGKYTGARSIATPRATAPRQ